MAGEGNDWHWLKPDINEMAEKVEAPQLYRSQFHQWPPSFINNFFSTAQRYRITRNAHDTDTDYTAVIQFRHIAIESND